MKKILSISILVIISNFAYSLPQWRSWTTQDGLDANFLVSVTFSPNKNVIIGAPSKHLYLFDGYAFSHLPNTQHSDRTFESLTGDLWTVDFEGIQQLIDDQWVQYKLTGVQGLSPPVDRYSPFEMASNLLPIDSKCVLYLTHDELIRFDPSSKHWECIKTAKEAAVGFFNHIVLSKDGNAWITGMRGAAKIYQNNTGFSKDSKWNEYSFQTNVGIEDLKHPIETVSGELFGTVYSIHAQKRILIRLNGCNWEIIPLHLDEDINMGWRGVDERIWYLHNPMLSLLIGRIEKNQQVYHEQKSDYSDFFIDAAHESNGSFWLATGTGLYRHAPATWRTPADMYEIQKPVHEIFEDKQGCIWFDCVDSIAQYQNEHCTMYDYPENRVSIRFVNSSFLSLADGRIVNFTDRAKPEPYSFCSNIIAFDPSKGMFEYINHPEGRDIRLLAPKRDGSIFVQALESGNAFDFRFEIFDGDAFTYIPDLNENLPWSEDYIYQILERKNGDIWFCGVQSIAVFSKGELTYITDNDEFSLDYGPYCIQELNDGKLWIGTTNRIVEWNGEKCEYLNQEFGKVNAILQSRDGSVWVASQTGLYRLYNGSWISNDKNDGLPSTDVYAVFEDSHGRIWAGTAHGVSVYHPDADRDPPETHIDREKSARRITAHGIAQFVFSGMDRWKFTEQDRLLYSYQIDQEDWSPFQSNTVAAITDLKAGDHTFQVRAMDRNLNVDLTPAGFHFEVMPPWYKEPYFLLIVSSSGVVILLLMGLHLNNYFNLTSLVQERTKHLLAQKKKLQSLASELSIAEERERRKIASDLHDRIGQSLALCHVQVETLRSNVSSTETKEELKNIRDTIKSTIKDAQSLTFEISPPILYELGLVQAVEWLAKQFQNQHGIRIRVENKGVFIAMHDDVRSFLFRAIRELLINVIKHAKAEQVLVTLESQKEAIHVTVHDDGIGLKENQNPQDAGFGLFSIKERIKIFGGVMKYTSTVNKGACVSLHIPVKREAGEDAK